MRKPYGFFSSHGSERNARWVELGSSAGNSFTGEALLGTEKIMEWNEWCLYMDVSENRGTPKSSILIGVSIINHPFWGIPIFGIFGNTHIYS